LATTYFASLKYSDPNFVIAKLLITTFQCLSTFSTVQVLSQLA